MTGADRPSPWRTRFAVRTYVAGALLALGGLTSLTLHAPDEAGWLALRLDAAGLLYTAASLIGGTNFFAAGVRAARTLRLDMNFLMSVAIVGAILIGEPFEAASLAFLFSVAELLERFAVDRGRRAIARLVELAPEEASVLLADGTVQRLPVARLGVGDRIRIRPGDRIPADGRVVAGRTDVNEATITGESVPQPKVVGNVVFAGTTNAAGAIDVEVTADAAHSTLSRIVELVRAAEGRRAPIEQFVARFARVYTPVVTALAFLLMTVPALAFGASGLEWFVRGLTLLVIACPCALVIATPVTVVSALTSAARHGVLIKGGEHLERLGAIQAFAFDKTGTLTTGRLQVQALLVADGTDERELLRRLAAAEARSEHPIATAIARYAEERGVDARSSVVEEFEATPGRGLHATVDGRRVWVGTDDFVGRTRPLPTAAAQSTTTVAVRTEDGLEGEVQLGDELREQAPLVVARLRRLGVAHIAILTGDASAPAERVRRATGADAVAARLLPAEKVAEVERLRQRFGSVAMLGDGVNDAPALATATVGIAMGGAGSPATIETADVALMADDLSRLPYAIALARRSRRVIRMNIAVALGLKAVLAVGAIAGVVSLAVAVLVGDLGASVAVTLSALRLARFK
ncbi:MAG: cadmium-translocating P-type ATPase [Gemmatimonadetes bacterium]|nr:cadmium-translocating P-type ATPase [Gemmatimonadota bacterium]